MEINDVVAEISADVKKTFYPFKKQILGYEVSAIVLGLVIGVLTGNFQVLAIFGIALPLIAVFVIFFGILYWFPATVAKKRGHAYTGLIQVLVIAGLFTGVTWFIALAWAVFPSEKSIIDPIVGNVTGLGRRNAGDTIGAAKTGTTRGANFENETDRQIDELIAMRTKGLIDDDEFARKKRQIIQRQA